MTANRPVTKLLVANRGEIARRVMRTATGMGIRTVAVYADSDECAPFVQEADEAIRLHGHAAADTYLDGTKILAAAARTGADAVHPGYGFLSEHAGFAKSVVDAGLIWVGPSPAVVASMGNKLEAKRRLAAAGVPMLPTIELDARTDLIEAVGKVGLPALVKAAAGGGGKGMRVVRDAAEIFEAVASARRESEAAFGDSTLFLEPYVTDARHVEVQILGDHHGAALHCFERECSIQRRHQKIIEEAPSPAVDPELRERMGAAAVAAAKAIGYESAGTVEFLLAADGVFSFLEVNTRLQVEHPVTEAITGLDLVREQILIAQGQPLGFAQSDLSISGHAIEARIYAEDPEHDFLPAAGELLVWGPATQPDARYDSGVETGSIIGLDFDPMLAKVIAHGPTRAETAGRLALALERTRIQGVVTNRDFLVATLRHPEFLAGNTTTAFIDVARPDRRRVPAADEVTDAAVVATLAGQAMRRGGAGALGTLPSGWRNSAMPPERSVMSHGGEEVVVEYRARRGRGFAVRVADREIVASIDMSGDQVDVELDGRRWSGTVHAHGSQWWVHGPAGDVQLEELPRFPEAGADEVAGGLVAPMPGRLVSVNVGLGDRVESGQLLAVLEAMKMEHRIVAPAGGIVTELRVKSGDQVANGDVLAVITDEH